MKIYIIGKGVTAKAIINASKSGHFRCVSDYKDADVIVASPGIPPEEFPQTQIPIISEIEFAYRLLIKSKTPPVLIGITGTNGKTTVTSLIGHVLDCPTAGNIGWPLITYIDVTDHIKAIAVEVSSFQLETCTTFRPKIAVITNITEDHLKRHKTMTEYISQKKKLIMAQNENDFLIYNADDVIVCDMVKEAKAQKIPFSLQDPDMELAQSVTLVGRHNHLNALAAIKTARIMGLKDNEIREKLKTFSGVKHRIQYIGTYKGRRFYNDSKATNPDSTIVALKAFLKPVCVLLCGEDKGLDLNTFVKTLQLTAKKAIVFSEIGKLIKPLSQKINPTFPVIEAKDLKEAIQKAMAETEAGDVILFSPSSSSFDSFRNFEHRGDVFIQTVKDLYETT